MSETPSEELLEAERARPSLIAVVATLTGAALLAVLVLTVPALHDLAVAAIHGESDEVRSQVEGLGAAGPLLILGLTLLHMVVLFPAEIVSAAAGFAYGFVPGLALMTTCWLISGLVSYAIGRSVARPLLDRWFGEARFERAEAAIERGGATLLLAARVLPIMPISLVSYAAGAARVPVWRFSWTSAVGYLPITAIAVYFGTRLEGLSLTSPLVFGVAGAFLVLLLVGHLIARRSRDEEDDAAALGTSEP
jgi:uncharacterized membrane protein YdjX (TVP38/TMEM64 family)